MTPWRARSPERNSADKKEVIGMTGSVVPLRPGHDSPLAAAEAALTAIHRYLDRCKLAPNTVKAYQRQTRAYLAWLTEHAADHPDAFADGVGAEAAVTAWRRYLIEGRAKPATINQALAAVTLMYEQTGLRIAVKRARVPKPGEPDALTVAEQGAVERAAARRGVRDAAIVAVLLYAGARVEESGRLELEDVAITARTGTVRLHGKGDEVRTVPLPALASRRGWMSAAANRARYGLANAGPHRLRHHPGRPGRRRGRPDDRPAPTPAAPHLRHPPPARRRRPRPSPSLARSRLPGHLGTALPSRTRRDRRRHRTRLQPVGTLTRALPLFGLSWLPPYKYYAAVEASAVGKCVMHDGDMWSPPQTGYAFGGRDTWGNCG
jgi:integrase